MYLFILCDSLQSRHFNKQRFCPISDWPDYESDSDTSQVEAIINQSTASISHPTTPTDETTPTDDITMDTTSAVTNHMAAGTSTPLLDLSHDFVDGNEQ